MEDHEKQLRKFIQQSDIELRALQCNLSALDHTISQHEIAIDTTKLGATQVQLSPRHAGHGAMTRAIRAALAQAYPKALTTDAVAAFVCTYCKLTPNEQEYEHIRYRIRIRLKCLVAEGRITRLHSSIGNTIGLWRDLVSDSVPVNLAAKGCRENSGQSPAKAPRSNFREIMARHHEQ